MELSSFSYESRTKDTLKANWIVYLCNTCLHVPGKVDGLLCYHGNIMIFQVLYFTQLQTKPKKENKENFFTSKDLPHMINPLEAKLGMLFDIGDI